MNSEDVILQDLAVTWEYLEPRLLSILKEVEKGVTPTDYMANYTMVYNHCQRKPGQPTNLEAQIDFTGGLLYEKYKKFIADYVKDLFSTQFEASHQTLLTFYTTQWTRYTTATKCIHNMFSYLNRHWIKRQNETDRKVVNDIYTLSLATWRKDGFEPLKTNLIKDTLDVVESLRNGTTLETSLVGNMVNSLVAIGFDEHDSDRLTLDYYRLIFEVPYLSATETYYLAESEAFILQNGITEYLKKAEARLNEEQERVLLSLHPSSLPAVTLVCENTLIKNYATQFHTEFQNLLDHFKVSDMSRMCSLLARIPNGLDALRDKFEVHVKAHGLAAVEAIAPKEDEELEPKIYIDAMLAVHERFHALLGPAFNGDAGFAASLDKACRGYINRNAVALPSVATKTPELLARYCDGLLKRNQKQILQPSQVEVCLSEVMIIFKFIDDKDVFQKFYSHSLAKRLVNSASASEELENSMIGKLKLACGFEYTAKLQKMFSDIASSRELNNKFKEHLKKTSMPKEISNSNDLNDKPMDLTVMVLGSAAWPFKPPAMKLNLPEPLSKPFERFEHYYIREHNNRKLNLLYQFSKGEIAAKFSKATKIVFTFAVSTYQMVILMLYNYKDSYTYEELMEQLNMDSEILIGPLGVLVKSKVLLLKGNSKEVGSPNSIYELNLGYNNKKNRLNLNIPIKSELKKESEDTQRVIMEDRKIYIQAAMVRIMKARKTMKHVNLVNETITQLKSRFTPVVTDIKKAIDFLIEKEYIMRDENDRDTFVYLA